MANVVRITAEWAGDPNAPADSDWKMVLDAALEGAVIKKQLCFGFAALTEDGATTRWPFILRPAAPQSERWVLDYGADSKDAPQPTNIVEKEIRVDNFFTVWDGVDEMTFRITQVNEL